FVYPPLAIAVAAFGAALYFLTGRSRGSLLVFSAAVILLCATWFGFLLHMGLGQARDVLHEETALKWAGRTAAGATHFLRIVRDVASGFPLAPVAILVVLGAMRLHRRFPRRALLLVLLLPIIAIPFRGNDLASGTAGSHYMANMGLIGLPLLYMLRREQLAAR